MSEEVIEEGISVPVVYLSKAKPARIDFDPWGDLSMVPNCDGIFVPYVPQLASYDIKTVPELIE